MMNAAHREVARLVGEEPGLLRRASASGVLALLAASALSPVAIEVLGGGSLASAIAGVAGNVGSGYLTDLVTGIAARLRRKGSSDVGEARALLTAELESALEKNDATAEELRVSLTVLLSRVGGLETANDDLRGHLLSCFEELARRDARRDAEQRRRDQSLRAAQRRTERRLARQDDRLQEIIDRLRLLTPGSRPAADPAGPRIAGPVAGPVVVSAASRSPARAGLAWTAGREIGIGDRMYLLQDVLLAERTNDDGTVSRQARALRTVPRDGRDRYVWLRQVQAPPEAAGRWALRALEREHRLLSRLREPRVGQYETDGHTVTLALAWPASRSHGPYPLLSPSDPPGPFSLLGGLAGLCDALGRLHRLGAAHRFVTPERIVLHDDGRLSLLDLGLAGTDHTPGEGPAGYQAPEQRRRGAGRPGPYTDVYQLAAVAYHLLTGHPPHPRSPLPVRARASDAVPEPAGSAIDAALAADPGARPTAQSFGAALRAARDLL